MTLARELVLGLFLDLLCLVSLREVLDPSKSTLYFYYGNTPTEYREYKLSEAEKVVDDPEFIHDKTSLFIPDYYEAQLSEYWGHQLSDAYESTNDVNYFLLYWGGPLVNSTNDLKDIDSKAVQQMLTNFLLRLSKHIEWSQLSLVAYAEGCVLAGNVAEQIYGQSNHSLRIDRLTMLDPPKDFVLDGEVPGSLTTIPADFVDAIHTDIGGFGTNLSRSHVDFFPNGGYGPQPGCENRSKRKYKDLHFFNYLRTLQLCVVGDGRLCIGQSIVNSMAFLAYKANSYEEFKSKFLFQLGQPVFMGYVASRNARGKYYLDTKASSPYGGTLLD